MNGPHLHRGAHTLARAALGTGAVLSLVPAFFWAKIFWPDEGPDGELYAGLAIDPISVAEANGYRIEVIRTCALCLLVAAAQVAVGWVYPTRAWGRWLAVAIGGCYLLLGLSQAVAWLGHRDAPALLVYAGLCGALGAAIVGAFVRERQVRARA
jgi:hypothetical protein